MFKLFEYISHKHQNFWNRQNFILATEGFLLLSISLLIEHFANIYTSHVGVVAVPDVILDNIPTINANFIVVQGAVLVFLTAVGLMLFKPRFFSFTLKAVAVFVLVRSISITLTHLGPSGTQIPFNTNLPGYWLYNLIFNSQNDFFFSGHTGLAFLMSLIFWQNKIWRWWFLFCCTVLAVAVLITHQHYSIDVFAAPFITYAIFALCVKAFPKDFATAQT